MSYLNARTPTGGDVIQSNGIKPAFSEDLLGKVLQRSNLITAWKHVRANKGAAGIDGMTIDEFPVWAKEGHWQVIVRQLESGCYWPSPVKRVIIEKPDGGQRLLGIPTITD